MITKRIIQLLNDLEVFFVEIAHDKDFLNKTTRRICKLMDGKIREV